MCCTQRCVSEVPRTFDAIVAALGNNPAYLHDPHYDVLTRNRAADELFDQFGEQRQGCANLLLFMFLDPAAGWLCNRAHYARLMGAHFRLIHDRTPGDRALEALVAKLKAVSPEFRTYWDYHEVLPRGAAVKTFDHPRFGALSFTSSTLQAPDAPGLSLCVYIAHPGQAALG